MSHFWFQSTPFKHSCEGPDDMVWVYYIHVHVVPVHVHVQMIYMHLILCSLRESIFASQEFSLTVPPLFTLWFCNSRGSPSSCFHKPCLQRWHHFWPMGAFYSFVFKHVAIVYIFNCIHVMFPWSIVSGDLIGSS